MRISDWSSDVCSSDLIDATAGVSSWRTSFQNEAVACGSRSMIAATLPACSAATARQVASVVFPTPPFCERMARTFMLHSYTYRSEEHTSELQSLMRISYAVFCLNKKKKNTTHTLYKLSDNNTQH